jgi:subtilisin family serine protease
LELALTLLFFIATSGLTPAPLYGEENPDKIDGQYIVIYHENTTIELMEEHWNTIRETSKLLFTYNFGTFKGFASRLSPRVLSGLLVHPLVKEIHYDGLESIVGNSCGQTQTAVPSWGLARVSQKGSAASGLRNTYYYNSQASGSGVYAYVLDTGIFIEHDDFGGRASYGANFVDQVGPDQNGHGSHCAGTIGGTTYGIAKSVKLIAVKVLGRTGSGATSGVIAGIQWVTEQHIATGGPSVASMSLGSTSDGGKNAAITASVGAGVVYSVAAGNSNGDACSYYPASCPAAITVGATQIRDVRSSFSNYGRCVDVFAPGSEITSCGISSRTASAVLSGTSMACPHVSGVVAVILSQNPTATPAQVVATLVDNAQNGLITSVGANSPNKLLYNKCDEA